ncbi:hypothetical protein FOZ62_004222 [Perkinsus olseni]|uniref:Major facilitator superfamily (MFS) profile domain-containing protein n=1 Tax=Perkinsus olseni TaxID=32597 RepID=A0A7J6QG99_PEROL|nr:hypothetical protein FOZ62_004222 [Perkinsus olseni]
MQTPLLRSYPRMADPSETDALKERAGLILKLGSGFFADAYDLFIIDIVLAVLDQLPASQGLGLTSGSRGLIACSTSLGAVIGMVFFGVVGDRVGRRAGILCTGSLVFLGSMASSLVVRTRSFPLAYQLCLTRFVLGFGIGGEYPLSAAMAAEKSQSEVRGRVVAAVFSMQGVGMIAAALVPLVVLSAGLSLELAWRLLLCFAVVPSGLSLYWRFGLEETSAFDQLQYSRSRESDVWSTLRATIREHWTPLLGAALSWLLMDVTFYGTAEFKHEVADSLFAQKTGVAQVERDAWFALVVSVIALPGYVCACLFIDTVGRFRLQAVGFAMMTLFYLIMAASTRLGAALWVNLLIFSATFFWTNFGPNVTTYIVPSEIFPVASRTTCHGICAASGKIGAIAFRS